MARLISRSRTMSAIALALIASAVVSTASAGEYRLSMLPMLATEEIHNRITPLAKHLSRATGLQISTVLASDFSQYSQQLSSGAIQIGFENPYIYVKNSEAHEAIALASSGTNGDKFRGIIITRSGSPINSVNALRGKRISIVSRTSTGGYLSQKLTLQQNGIDIDRDCTVEEAAENKQENVIFSVFNGDVDAGFIRESAFSQVKDFVPPGALRILESTAWMPNWVLSVSRTMPEADRRKIIDAAVNLQPGSPVLKAMKIDSLEICTDSMFDAIREAAGIEITTQKKDRK